jgi:hypothetical protein
MHTTPVTAALSSVVVGPPVMFRTITMYPLLTRDPGARRAPGYRILDDALALGLVEVTEVSEQGSVPNLRVVNRSPDRILIVDGEELVGAKQNRVVNLTILVNAHSELTIPVSCVEAGRWRLRSRTFSSAPRTQYASGRAKRMAQVTASMKTAGRHYSDQSEVWADIADMSVRLKSSSPTGAMSAIFSDHATFIDQCAASMPVADNQVGAIFMIGSRVVGADLFDAPETMSKLLPKLLRGVAVDALDAEGTEEPTGANSIELFLAAVAAASVHEAPAVGGGLDLRLTSQGVTGAALVDEGSVVHLSAFVTA